MASKPKPISTNTLLALLPRKDFARLKVDFEEITMTLRSDLSQPAGAIEHVYFPLSGMISLVPALQDGTIVEVGLIGREGFLGVPLLLAGQASPINAIVQGDGEALRMKASVFLKEVEMNAVFREILLRYAQALLVQITQTAICNVRHPLPQRLGRWLLEAHDRVEGNDLPLSHEFLSFMLGTRRAGITVALGEFSEAGLVTIGRSTVGIRNRKGIEAAACECYRSAQEQYARIFP